MDNENNLNENTSSENQSMGQVTPVSGLYQDWFLDYASYVILERAVPGLNDGLKPVQRRILHSMHDLDDGRYNKVANIIGHTMKYHPHGDASIGDALVQLGQKDLLIDCQGNWGNTLTGDGAAAPRYIEARLSKFAMDVVYNHKTTVWQSSYDGRNKEPVNLPIKFPLLLAQGGEGIAVGLACKMLPHNFNEILDGCIAYLRGRSFQLFPDFPSGGMVDVTQYNNGLRGGKIKVRSKIKIVDKKTLAIEEVPFGTTTSSLIESIIKANEKGKIKIKKIEDNTAATVEVIVHLHNDVSPDQMVDALYAFTDCEISISPNAVVIENDKPLFLGATDMLKRSTDQTVQLLKQELNIKMNELMEQWHFSSLEKIFIEERIYRDIEECETWEAVIEAIDKGLKPHIKHLKREVTVDDITRLTEIRIKRISKFDSFKADEIISKLENGIAETQNYLDNLVDYAVDYYKNIKKKYGAGKERKTEIRQFENIQATKVVVNNKKLYVNREEGFVGYGMRKDEFVCDCSDIDDVIVFLANGKMMVSKIADKAFFGKDILHVGIWKKGDDRTIYNMVYQDGKGGPSMMKRFAVQSITRDKEYDLTAGNKGSKVLYFTSNPNGEAELLSILLRPRPHLKKLRLEVDFSELAIKGRSAKGNILTKHLISKINCKQEGTSTLAARRLWFDETVRRVNDQERGTLLGSFAGEDKILAVYEDGQYKLYEPKTAIHLEESKLVHIGKFNSEAVASVIYWDGEKDEYKLKRFQLDVNDRLNSVITEHENSRMELFTFFKEPKVNLIFDGRSADKASEEVELNEFISVKGMSAKGNRLTQNKIKSIEVEEMYVAPEPEVSEINEEDTDKGQAELF